MKNEFEKQLDMIRIELYEKTKGMSNADAANATNERGRFIAKEHGIAVVKNDPSQQSADADAQ